MLIKNVTHADMDGVGCSIILSHLFKDKMELGDIEITKTSYSDLHQTIMNTISYPQEDTILIISDLGVDTEFLKKILEIPHIKKLLYIDHHERSDSRTGLDSLKYFNKGKFQYRWRKGFSATASVYEFCLKSGIDQSKELDYLVKVIDAYDEWKLKDPKFNEGLALNEIYWDIGFDEFFNKFYHGLEWTLEMKRFVKDRFNEQNEYFKNNEEFIQEFELGKEKVLISFNPQGKYNNLYSLRYDANLFILFDYESNSLKKFSLRASNNSKIDCNVIARDIADKIKGGKGGGHKGAAGLSVPTEVDLEELFDAILEVLSIN